MKHLWERRPKHQRRDSRRSRKDGVQGLMRSSFTHIP